MLWSVRLRCFEYPRLMFYPILSNGLGDVADTTRVIDRRARLRATYSLHLATSASGKLALSHGISSALSHSRPFALWIVVMDFEGGIGRA